MVYHGHNIVCYSDVTCRLAYLLLKLIFRSGPGFAFPYVQPQQPPLPFGAQPESFGASRYANPVASTSGHTEYPNHPEALSNYSSKILNPTIGRAIAVTLQVTFFRS